MSYDLYLSYSGKLTYIGCPKEYKFVYKDNLPRVSRPKDFMFGSVIGKVFEWFYTEGIWASYDVVKRTIDLIDPAIKHVCEDRKVDLNATPGLEASLIRDLYKFVPSGVATIQGHKLLSPNSVAEMKLHITCSMGDDITLRLGGYADFVHIHDNSIWIMDGKGSKYREKYVDAAQLIWYATQFYLKYHIAPSRLGFIYWRFPNDPIQWIEYDAQSIRDNIEETFSIAKKILSEQFEPKVSDGCRRCAHSNICDEGKAYLSTVGSRLASSSILSLDEV